MFYYSLLYTINIHYSVFIYLELNRCKILTLALPLLNIMYVHLNVGSVADVALLPDPKSVCQRHHPLVQEFNSSGQ